MYYCEGQVNFGGGQIRRTRKKQGTALVVDIEHAVIICFCVVHIDPPKNINPVSPKLTCTWQYAVSRVIVKHADANKGLFKSKRTFCSSLSGRSVPILHGRFVQILNGRPGTAAGEKLQKNKQKNLLL